MHISGIRLIDDDITTQQRYGLVSRPRKTHASKHYCMPSRSGISIRLPVAVENARPSQWIRNSFIQLNRPVPLPIQIPVHERQARG